MSSKVKARMSSTASKSVTSMAGTTSTPGQNANGASDATSMPPPKDPPQHVAMLEPEMTALSGCLRNAVIKTGQLYGFHADSRRLGIHKYAPNPPRTLITSLGREVEKYDQLCDAMESHLLRAIYLLQRDLAREQRSIKEAENAAIATRTRSKSLSKSPTSTRIPLPSAEALSESANAPPQGPSQSPPTSAGPPGRRQSAISLSSLHRPSAPLKLDLSASSLRITAEEASMFSKGLASPVTLAPKSARPSASADIDLMAAFASASGQSGQGVDIDLTQSSPVDMRAPSAIDVALGNSADKPIELDLDAMDIEMSDLFGDSEPKSSTDEKMIKEEGLEMELFDALSAVEGDGSNSDLFASLHHHSGNQSNAGSSTGDLTVPLAHTNAPSPATLLASFASGPHLDPGGSSSSDNHIGSGFDLSTLDLANLSNLSPSFFANHESDMSLIDMEELLNVGQGGINKDRKLDG